MARRPKVMTNEAPTQQSEEASGDQPKQENVVTDWPRALLCPFPSCGARQLSSAAKDIKPGVKECIKCRAGLTPMNRAPDITPETKQPTREQAQTQPEPRKDEPRPGGGSRFAHSSGSTRDVAAPNPDDVGETVSATWGEELYSPQQFCTFRVGSFTRTTKIREGETALDAKRRIYAEMRQMAEDERHEKMSIYLEALGHMFTVMKGGSK